MRSRNTLVPASGRQLDLIFKLDARRTERQGSQGGDFNAGLPADAGRMPRRRGAHR